MGSTWSQRVRRKLVSRRRTQPNITKIKTHNNRTVGGSSGNNKTVKKISS